MIRGRQGPSARLRPTFVIVSTQHPGHTPHPWEFNQALPLPSRRLADRGRQRWPGTAR
jgi:hypothetical protein